MSATHDEASTLPDLAEILGRVIGRVPAERQPLLLAIAERLAAERYRAWADSGITGLTITTDQAEAMELMASLAGGAGRG